MPSISVVLPTRNGERFLDEAVRSVVCQSYADWELVIVNDASSDNSALIADGWAGRDARIRVIHLPVNRRLPGALNDGFAVASGSLFTWTSDDNLYAPHAFARLSQVLENGPQLDIVYSASTWIDESGRPVKDCPARPPDDLPTGNVVGACFLYRRKVHEALGGFSEDLYLAEDYDFWLRAYGRFRFEPLDEPLYSYRRHDGSLTDRHQAAIVAATARTLERWLQSAKALSRRSRGRALESLGLRALVVGDVRSARRYLWRASWLLGRPPRFRQCRSYAPDLLLGRRCGDALRRALGRG